MIDKRMYNTLYDYDSYQPIETRVSEAYSTLYNTDSIRAMAILLKRYLDEANDYKSKADDAKSTMDIWSDSYTSYGRSKYRDARKEWIDNSILYFSETKLAFTLTMLAYESIKDFHGEPLDGWEVYHRYRCKSKGGSALLCEEYFYVDKDIKTITKVIDLDDEEYKTSKSLINEIRLMDDEKIKEYQDMIEGFSETIESFEKLK